MASLQYQSSQPLSFHIDKVSADIIQISPEGVVDQGVFHEGGEHEADTNALPDVNSLGVGHGRQSGVDGGCLQEEDHGDYHDDS